MCQPLFAKDLFVIVFPVESQRAIYIHDNFNVSVFGIAFSTGIYTKLQILVWPASGDYAWKQRKGMCVSSDFHSGSAEKGKHLWSS